MPKPLTVWITINWKILQEMGIPDHLTCLLRNLCAGQEATVRTGHGKTDKLHIRKGVCQGCILSPCLFNLYAEYIMWNVRLEEAQDGIKTAWRNINNLRYTDDTTLMAESEDGKVMMGKIEGKSSLYNAGDLGSISGLGRFPGEGNGNPLQYSCLENPMDGGVCCRLLSMGSQRFRHDWATSFSLKFFKIQLNFSIHFHYSLYFKLHVVLSLFVLWNWILPK